MDDKFILEEARSTNTQYKGYNNLRVLVLYTIQVYFLLYPMSFSPPLPLFPTYTEQSPLSFIFEETAYDSAKGLFASIVRQKQDEHM